MRNDDMLETPRPLPKAILRRHGVSLGFVWATVVAPVGACDGTFDGSTLGPRLDGYYSSREECEETLPSPMLCETCVCAATRVSSFEPYCYDGCCVVGESMLRPGESANHRNNQTGETHFCRCTQGAADNRGIYVEEVLPDAVAECEISLDSPDGWTCPGERYAEIVPTTDFDTHVCDCGCGMIDPDCAGRSWFTVDDCDRWPEGCVVDDNNPTLCILDDTVDTDG